MSKYILSLPYHNTKLFLGKSKDSGNIDCIEDIQDAFLFESKEEARDVARILAHGKYWQIEEIKDGEM